MKHMTDGRLDWLPQPPGTSGALVPGCGCHLRAAARERAQRVATARERQSATDFEVLLGNLETVVAPSFDVRYSLQQVSVLVRALQLFTHARPQALGPERHWQEQAQVQWRALLDLLVEHQSFPHLFWRDGKLHPCRDRRGRQRSRQVGLRVLAGPWRAHSVATGLTSTRPHSIARSSAARLLGRAVPTSRKLRSTETASGAAARLTAPIRRRS